METMLLRVLQTHVLDQCNSAIRGLRAMEATIWEEHDDDGDAFWHACQSFLTGAANVSKLLWGIRGKGEAERLEQRRPLRESLGMTDDSPLRVVAMRNHFEHLDERIFDWWVESPRHILADRIIGPDDTTIGGLEDREKFRQFNPTTRELVFWGDRHDVGAVAAALVDLQRRAAAEAEKPWW